MTITMDDLQIVALKVRLQRTREQLIKVRDAISKTGNEDLLRETNKVIDGAWHTLNFDVPETSDAFESRLDHRNPYKHGCDPALADHPIGEGMKRTQEIMQGDVDMGRPACGQGDEWSRHPTDALYGEPKSCDS
ncbi:MAG: hypothetical protein V4477_16630 [Pseudomonadota bacterium]